MRKISLSWAECAVLLLVATMLASIYALIKQEQRVTAQAVERTVDSARVLTSFAQEAHSQYSSSTSAALQNNTIGQSSDGAPKEGYIHFPATFSRSLTERFSKTHPGTSFSIYSDDPFMTSKQRSLDKFAIDALAMLQNDRQLTEYWKQQTSKSGQTQIRYATPIVLTQGCVACHNSPSWGLKKTDWKAGDVRGVREVTLNLPIAALQIQPQFYLMCTLILISSGLGLFFVIPNVRSELKKRTHFEWLSKTLSIRSRSLEKQSQTDTHTGLSNRRHFDELLDAYVEEFSRNNVSIALAVFDLDHFKSVNDTWGHDIGDRVIAEVGKVLSSKVREHDFAARIGIEEFALVIPNIPTDTFSRRTDEIREAITQMHLKFAGALPAVTISAGTAMLGPQESSQSLRKRAEDSLREAKMAGRNRVFSSRFNGPSMQVYVQPRLTATEAA